MTQLPISEADFQQQVISYARLRRWRVMHGRPAQDSNGRWKTPIQGDTGFPDLVLARGGRVLFVELKSDTGSLGAAQAEWRDAIQGLTLDRRFHTWHLWRPSDWPTVEEVLR